jgi:hypothetical protein
MPTIQELAESLGVPNLRSPGRRFVGVSESDVADTARLYAMAWSGDPRARLAVNESLTTSDLFVSASGEVFDRELRAEYATGPVQWRKFAARTLVNDFRPKKLVDLLGGRGTLAPVPERTHYPIASQSSAEIELKVAKYGEQFGYSFEARRNDRLNELQRLPGGFADKALRTEDSVTLAALANTLTGAPNTAFFSAGNKNIYSGAFTSENIQAALTSLRVKRDTDGNLIPAGELQVVVGPALAFAAQRIFGATEYRTTTGGIEVIESNPLRGTDYTVLDNLPGSAWFIIPKPTSPRPAIYAAFLVGNEAPDLRVKKDQGARPGGGDVPVEDGSFDDDTVWWRVRHIVGGAPGDPTLTMASDGTGTTLTKTGWS